MELKLDYSLYVTIYPERKFVNGQQALLALQFPILIALYHLFTESELFMLTTSPDV